MLSWLPIIGPLIDGIVSIVKGAQDTTLGKYTQDTIRIGKETDADVAVIQSRTALAIAMKDDIGSRLSRDLVMFPAAMWAALKFFEAMFIGLIPMWHIADVPTAIEYIPYAVIAYLFVTAYRGSK